MITLEKYRLMKSIFCGAELVIENKEELNKINVFPVADGDTGSNLASLMHSILNNVAPQPDSIQSLLSDISEAALIGARGNSGLIFAQYLNALAENYSKVDNSTSNFVNSLKAASLKAYEAVMDPKEGTILSVIRLWSDTLEKEFFKTKSFSEALVKALQVTERAVEDTKFQLSVLKKNNLVDSGAKGFYYFIFGFTKEYCEKKENFYDSNPYLVSTGVNKNLLHRITDKPEYRFCAEFILNEVQITTEDMRKRLKYQGDSLIVIGNQKKSKIHIHTNSPKNVLKILEKFGEVTYQKVDDMLMQYLVTKKRKSPIAIVTDSIADLPSSYLLEHQVHCLPINILSDNQVFLDKLTLDAKLIKEKIVNKQNISTAQPTIPSVDALLSFLEDKYEHVLVLTVSSELSGTYQLIAQRIKEMGLSEKWIKLIDSKTNSVAQGLLVKRAVSLIEKNIEFEIIVKKLKNLRSKTFIYVAVADLEPMIQSGRIPQKLGRVLKKLSVVPIVSLDKSGRGVLKGIYLNQKHSTNKITKIISGLVEKHELEEVAIAHVSSYENAKMLSDKVEIITGKPCDVIDSSAAIAISAGIGSIAIAGIKKEENE